MESFGKSLCALSVISMLIHLLMQGALQVVPPLTCFLSFLHRFCIIEQLESKFDFHLDCTLRRSLSHSPGSVSCWGTIECNEPFLSPLCLTTANAKFALRTITLSLSLPHLVDVPNHLGNTPDLIQDQRKAEKHANLIFVCPLFIRHRISLQKVANVILKAIKVANGKCTQPARLYCQCHLSREEAPPN